MGEQLIKVSITVTFRKYKSGKYLFVVIKFIANPFPVVAYF